MTEVQGGCHCGAVKFSFEAEAIEAGVRCNCSICARKGILMSTQVLAPDDLKIDAEPGALGLYQFGDRVAKHFFCKTCGIHPFNQTVRMPGHYRVNLGCIHDLDSFSLPVEVFDGKHLL